MVPWVDPSTAGHSTWHDAGFDGDPDLDIIERVDELIAKGPFQVHIARTFPLAHAADAHRALGGHYLGKLALRTS